MNEMTLTDSTMSYTWGAGMISSPFSELPNFGETAVNLLSGNVYTDFVYKKRRWENTFDIMSSDEYDIIEGFVERQYSTNEYPLLTLSDGSAIDVPVKISINGKRITNLCGDVESVVLSMIESGQNVVVP